MNTLIELAAVTLICYYIVVLSRRVDIGLISLLAVEIYDFTFGVNGALFGGIHIDPLDAVSICLLAAGVIRSFHGLKKITVTHLVAIGYLALFAISLGRGFYSNGTLAVANEGRGFVGPLSATLYFLTAPTDDSSIRRYVKAYLYFGAALCLAAVLAAVGFPIGMNAWAQADLTAIDGRYLPATAAAAIAVCGFFSLALLRYARGGILRLLVPVMFMSAAIYLRHRTVWMMLLAGALALMVLDGKLFRRLLPAALVAGAAVAVLAVYGGNVEGLVSENQFTRSATNSQTLEWRLNGWKELVLDDEQNAMTIAIGKSMGGGYWRIDPVSYQAVEVAPHSEYIQEYLRVGVIGTFLVFLLCLRPFVKLWKLNKVDPAAIFPTTSIWAVVLLCTLVYGLTYGIQPHSYALIGIANAIFLGSPVPAPEGVLESNPALEFAVPSGFVK
jgi:hypothetical protein